MDPIGAIWMASSVTFSTGNYVQGAAKTQPDLLSLGFRILPKTRQKPQNHEFLKSELYTLGFS